MQSREGQFHLSVTRP
nr:unnamed protein product [Callosobruchus chinensis]